MTNREYVLKELQKIKNNIAKSYGRQKYNQMLGHISLGAVLLYLTNIYYEDDELEKALSDVTMELRLNTFATANDYAAKDDTILFYDGFGLNERGLIQIYLKALCKEKRVIYVTYDEYKEQIPDVKKLLAKYECEIRYINRKNENLTNQIEQLNSLIKEFRPQHMFFYSVPYDVVATPIMYAYVGYITRYQINLTDHAFWLGANCIDKCIEFREYGAKISAEYRKIPREKIIIIPFYPVIHREKTFQGFPFEVSSEQKVMFSGGALYKTLGEDNKYYKMVEHILENHEDLIFWYAGKGDDTQMKKILNKFCGRAYLTCERSDLFQVLEHSSIYLSTYPMCGGLMFQYAAMAGCVPVTLKSGNISDGFLINQEDIAIEFDDLESLYEEVDRLLSDADYADKRSKLMKKSVISETVFNSEVEKLIQGIKSDSFLPKYEHIDTDKFRAWFTDEITKAEISLAFVRKDSLKIAITHYLFEFIRGGMHTVKKIILGYLT